MFGRNVAHIHICGSLRVSFFISTPPSYIALIHMWRNPSTENLGSHLAKLTEPGLRLFPNVYVLSFIICGMLIENHA